jgi:iron complex transport system substrate-binding protein
MTRKFLAMILALGVMLGACAPAAAPIPTVVLPTAVPTAEPTPEPVALTDGMGRAVKLAAPAQRVVSLAPSNTEILFALGAGAQVVGRDELSNFPREAKDVTSIGSTYGQLNTEAIVALNPDLVLAAQTTEAAQVKTLEGLGLTVYWLPNPKDFDGLYQNLAAVGQLTGHAPAAQALSDDIKARVAAVTEKVKGAQTKPKVYYELDATDPTKPFTSGPGTFVDMLISMAGGQNIGATLKGEWAQISSEELVQQNPDIILLGDAAYGVSAESVGQRAGWASLAAVQNQAVYAFDDNLVSRPGPRLADGLEIIARLLHPELFK